MQRFFILALALFTAAALVAADTAEAKRLGGGQSMGTQRQAMPAPTPPAASSAAPLAPAQALPGKAAQAPSTGSRWLGPLAGLAAGIGLMALLSHFGIPEGFGSVLMLGLLAAAGIMLIRMFFARRAQPARSPMQYASATASLNSTPGGYETQAPPRATFDSGRNFEPVFGGASSTVNTPPPSSGKFPPGFDPAPLAEQAKLRFRRLQAAYDSGDRKALADVMTPEMFSAIVQELAARGPHTPTEVVGLDAQVLEVTTEGDTHWASVHFKGMLREDGMVLAKPFDEVWNLAKPVDGSTGWLLAGIQQLA
jgi:predicted lipid-binding transport protein (Tim44 family)